MDRPSNTEVIATRYAPYIEELRDFFASHGMSFGCPENIVRLAEHVSAPGSFHNEMASMIRSIIYRERGTVPRAELIELIAVAIGGPHIDEAAQEVHEPVRQLFAFVGGVLRSRRNASYPEDFSGFETPAESSEATSSYIQRQPETVTEIFVEAPPTSELHGGTDVELNSCPASDIDATVDPLTSISSRTGTMPSNREASSPTEFLDSSVVPTSASQGQGGSDRTRYESVIGPESPHNSSWILAICALPFVLFAVRLYHNRPAIQTAQVQTHTARIANPHNLATPEPVPHGKPMGNEQSPATAFGIQGTAFAVGVPTRLAYRGLHEPVEQVGHNSQGNAAGSSFQAPSADHPKLSAPSTNPQTTAFNPDPDRASASLDTPHPLPPGMGRRGHPVGRTYLYNRQGSFSVSSGVIADNLIDAPAPEYPKLARFAHREGQVILQAVVSRNGTVVATHVLHGPWLLRRAAATAVRRWRYRPYVVNGRATNVATIVTIDFRLRP